ncbi:MAG TPA: MarR family winged helix-turn-helix transcriptional regulator [Pirellulales bacterium]|nr:MarR family winged helix-turn-helix transcriptional regulator [Pirellulales bacterium]
MSKTAIDTIASQCLGARIRLLNRLISGVYDRALRPHGLRISQLNVLVSTAARGPLRASELCRLLKLEKSTLSRDLERLIEQGWISRSPQLEITAAGRRHIAQCLPAWRRAQREARRLLTPPVADGTMEVVGQLWLNEGL